MLTYTYSNNKFSNRNGVVVTYTYKTKIDGLPTKNYITLYSVCFPFFHSLATYNIFLKKNVSNMIYFKTLQFFKGELKALWDIKIY